MSGVAEGSRRWMRNRKPRRCRALLTASSGFVFSDAMRDMFALRPIGSLENSDFIGANVLATFGQLAAHQIAIKLA